MILLREPRAIRQRCPAQSRCHQKRGQRADLLQRSEPQRWLRISVSCMRVMHWGILPCGGTGCTGVIMISPTAVLHGIEKGTLVGILSARDCARRVVLQRLAAERTPMCFSALRCSAANTVV